MFTAALFTMAKMWKQPKHPLAEEWIKIWYVCVCIYIEREREERERDNQPVYVGYYSAIQKTK